MFENRVVNDTSPSWQSRWLRLLRGPALIGLVCMLNGAMTQTADAQVVQLPTFRVFNVNTAVKVPDGGAMRLGGINRSATGSTARGVPGLSNIPGPNRLFKNRAIGSETSSANISVTADIIVMSELEEQVLAEAARRIAQRIGDSPASAQIAADHPDVDVLQAYAEVERLANFITQHVGRRP